MHLYLHILSSLTKNCLHSVYVLCSKATYLSHSEHHGTPAEETLG